MILILSTSSFAATFNVWKVMDEAATFEAEKNLQEALPLWLSITNYFEGQKKDEDNYINLAIFYKKIAKFYDKAKDYSKAVEYYELENENWVLAGKNWGAEDLLRADEIRTTFEYFKKINTKKIDLAKYEPESGIYLGIYSENDKAVGQDFYKTENVYGKHSIYLLYQDWGTTFNYDLESDIPIDIKLALRAKKENSGLQIAMNAPDGLESVTKDKWLISWAKEAKKLDMPIFLRFLGEMNGDWVPWHGKPELFIEKFKLVHDVMAEYAPNVVMVWTPNDLPIETKGIRIEDYYPGDNYVDWVGVNFYIDYYDSGNTSEESNLLQNPLTHIDYIYNKYANKKTIMICEIGVTHYSIPNKKDVTDWAVENLKKLYLQFPIKYPRIKGINYFSLNQENENYIVGNRWNNYAISENDKMTKEYKKIIQDDIFLGEITDEANFSYEQIDNLSDFVNENEIYYLLKIPDYKISKVEFYSDEKLLSIDSDLPYSLKTDYSKINELIIKIYDSKNKLSLIKTLVLNPDNKEQEIVEEEIIDEKIVEQIANQDEILVKVPSFKVNINNEIINNYSAKYPFVTYNNITYFPMTYNYSRALGLEVKWSDETGLSINQNKNLKGEIVYDKGESNSINKFYKAILIKYNLNVNGKNIDNSVEEYPIFNLNNITYFPLTWRFVVDEFRWENKFDSRSGLSINR